MICFFIANSAFASVDYFAYYSDSENCSKVKKIDGKLEQDVKIKDQYKTFLGSYTQDCANCESSVRISYFLFGTECNAFAKRKNLENKREQEESLKNANKVRDYVFSLNKYFGFQEIAKSGEYELTNCNEVKKAIINEYSRVPQTKEELEKSIAPAIQTLTTELNGQSKIYNFYLTSEKCEAAYKVAYTLNSQSILIKKIVELNNQINKNKGTYYFYSKNNGVKSNNKNCDKTTLAPVGMGFSKDDLDKESYLGFTTVGKITKSYFASLEGCNKILNSVN